MPEPLRPMMDSDLLDPYEKMVEIEILGSRVEVPENNRLLRCFQYLSLRSISYGDFCWNGDCTNCQIWYHSEGQTQADDRPALSCRMLVSEGMVITKMSDCVELEGINKEPSCTQNQTQNHGMMISPAETVNPRNPQ
jgi:hypothetical protein